MAFAAGPKGTRSAVCMDVPEAYGGFGVKDFRYNAIITEELAYTNSSSLNFAVHTDVTVPYLIHYGNEEQKQRWLPKCVTGECITAIAMSEPNTGSDLQGVGTIGKFQNSRFKLAEMKTEITIGRTFVDQCITELNVGTLTTAKASMAKYWLSELQARVVDQCLQLHGGYGFMSEYPISKMYTDARVNRIYGGTNEIMREIIGRSMGF